MVAERTDNEVRFNARVPDTRRPGSGFFCACNLSRFRSNKITKQNALTLMELIIVVIIIGILISIAVPNYRKAIEKTKDQEARSALDQILRAQKVYRLKDAGGNYAWALGAEDVNNLLGLDLKEINWEYAAGDPPTVGTAQAKDYLPGWDRYFTIDSDGTITCSGCSY